MESSTSLLAATLCFSLFGITGLASIRSQTTAKPAQTVQRLFEMLDKGETDGIQKLVLLPGASDPEVAAFVSDFKKSLADTARDFKRRGGVKSVKIFKQEVVGERAEVNVELTLGDGTTTMDNLTLIMDHNEWKIDLSGNLAASTQAANETAAISSVQAIARAQIIYSLKKGSGEFTDLATLGKEGLIDSQLASGEKQGYLFTSKRIPAKAGPAMFDTTAKPKLMGTSGTGNRCYYSNETMVVYEATGGDPPSATSLDRVPKNGSPIR